MSATTPTVDDRPAKPSWTAWRDFALLFAGAFLVRFVYLLEARSCPAFDGLVVDAESYWRWSEAIVAGDWLGDRVFYQAPLYPYGLALVKLVVGSDLWRVRLVQIAVGALACGVLYLAARRFVGRRAGLVAGALLALYPSAIFFDTCIQKAGLGLLEMALLLWTLAHLRDRPRALTGGLVGCVLGTLMLTREETILLVPVTLLWFLVAFRSLPWQRRAGILASALGGLALVLLPVATRNQHVGGEFVLSTSQAGTNFYIGNGPRADGTYVPLRPGRHDTDFERQDAFEMASAEAGRELGPTEVSSFWFAQSWSSIRADPARWLRLLGRKAALLVNAFEVPDADDLYFFARYSILLRTLETIWNYGLLVALAALGIALSWTKRRELAVLFVTLATLSVGVIAFYVFARYRYPVVPILIVFAGSGLVAVWDRARTAQRGTLLVPLACAALAWCASNLWRPYSRAAMLPASFDNAGIARAQQGRHAEALELFREAARLKPGSPEIQGNLGTSLLLLGRFEEAAQAFQRALDARPADVARAELRLGSALGQAGHAAESLVHLDRSLALLPTSVEALVYRSMALQGLGRWKDAVESLDRARALDERNVETRSRLAWTLATAPADEARDGQRALELAQALVDEASEPSAVLLDVLAAALAEQQRFDEALATIARALQAARARAPGLVSMLQAREQLYTSKRPFRLSR